MVKLETSRENTALYNLLLKTGSLDNAIREFSLAKPSWYMSHYTMIYKNVKRMRDSSNSYASFMLSKLPTRIHNSIYRHVKHEPILNEQEKKGL